MAKSPNSVPGAGPLHLPAPSLYDAFSSPGAAGPPSGGEKTVYIDGAGRFNGPAPDTEFGDLALCFPE